MIRKYLSYYFSAQNEYHLHSPFVYRLYTEVILPQKEYYAFQEIEKLRFQLLQNTRKIEVQDFGAGSRIQKSNIRPIHQIARFSLASPKEARLLFRLVNHLQPKTVVELGTSLGISTLYLSRASQKNHIYTFEGCPQIAQLAKQNFENLEARNIQVVVGQLEDTLSQTLNTIPVVDLAYLDANHQFEPTMRYFNELVDKSTEHTIFVLDDIHWSDEMESAWNEIKKDVRVSITIDLFSLGLVFFRKGIEKQNFILKF